MLHCAIVVRDIFVDGFFATSVSNVSWGASRSQLWSRCFCVSWPASLSSAPVPSVGVFVGVTFPAVSRVVHFVVFQRIPSSRALANRARLTGGGSRPCHLMENLAAAGTRLERRGAGHFTAGVRRAFASIKCEAGIERSLAHAAEEGDGHRGRTGRKQACLSLRAHGTLSRRRNVLRCSQEFISDRKNMSAPAPSSEKKLK